MEPNLLYYIGPSFNEYIEQSCIVLSNRIRKYYLQRDIVSGAIPNIINKITAVLSHIYLREATAAH